MNNIQKRFSLFLLGCIPLRLLFVYISKNYQNFLPYMGYIAFFISFGFFYIFFNNMRKTGPEVFGDKIWWNNLRPLHGILYLLFSIFAIKQKSFAWIFLLLDVVIGLFSFLLFHRLNFEKLIEK